MRTVRMTIPNNYGEPLMTTLLIKPAPETKSKYAYHSGYNGPHDFKTQIGILRDLWPDLNPEPALRYFHDVYAALKKPEWVEGAFAIVKPGIWDRQYGSEVDIVLEALFNRHSKDAHPYNGEFICPQHLKRTEQTNIGMRELIKQQSESDILVVGAQFGLNRQCKSLADMAPQKMAPGEYCSDTRNTALMFITHQDTRLKNPYDIGAQIFGDTHQDTDKVNDPRRINFEIVRNKRVVLVEPVGKASHALGIPTFWVPPTTTN